MTFSKEAYNKLLDENQQLKQVVERLKIEAKQLEEKDCFSPTIEYCEKHEEAIAKEKYYKAIFENTGAASIFIEKDGLISNANSNFAELSGYAVEEIVNKKKWMEFVVPQDLDFMMQQHNLRRLDKEKGSRSYEFRFIDRQREIKYILLHIDLIPETDISVASLQDITKLKETQFALKASAERWSFALEGSGDGVWDWDLKDNKVYYSPQWKSQLGYNLDEIVDDFSEWESRVHPEDIASANAAIKDCLDLKNTEYINEHRLRNKQGNYIWILDRGKVIETDESGNPTRFIGTHTDITERKQSEIQLETTFFGIEHASIGIFRVLDDGKLAYANQHACNALGYSKDEILKMTVFQIDANYNLEQLRKDREITDKASNQHFISEHIRKDGSRFPVEITSSFIEIKGEVIAFSFIKDISERLKSEKALRENEEKYRILVENQTDFMVKFDTDGNFLFVSPSYCKMFNKLEYELLGKSFLTLDQENDRRFILSALNQLSRESYNLRIEQRTLVDNDWKWIAWSYTAVFDDNDQIKEILGIGRDVTENKFAELQISEQERMLDSLISNLPGYVYRCGYDENWTMHFLSVQCEKITGYPPEVFLNNRLKTYNEIIAPKFQKKVSEQWEFAIENNTFFEGEYQIITKDNQIKWVWERGIGVYDEGGDLLFLEGYVEDITSKKQMIDDLIIAKDKAEESDRLKTAFLANMSHEIRTPMNGILGFTNLLLEPQLSGDQVKEYVEIIQKSGNRMLNTVNDIIAISRIETGQVEVVNSEFILSEEINDICKMLRPEAVEKGIYLTLHLKEISNEEIITADKTKFDSVITNLIKNAIKFTDEGGIDVICRKTKFAFEFEVKDTGCGIPKDRVSAVFDRFVQADIADKRALQGSGLGLAIAKSYVEFMEGDLSVESTINKGSSFCFTIPKLDESENTISRKSEKPHGLQQDLNILIVEDDIASIRYLNVILKEIAQNIYTVTDGREAVGFLKNRTDINLVLMDIKLPVMNGYEATQEIRENNNEIVIIAQTAYAISGDREKAVKAGCNDYITKPIIKNKLFDLLSKYF